MSVALNDPECDVSVTGTINNDGIQEERLEVIFALREASSTWILGLFVYLTSSCVGNSTQDQCLASENTRLKQVAAR